MIKRNRSAYSITLAGLLCIFCLYFPGSGRAYSVETGHAPLTQAALQAYTTCFPDDPTFRGDDSNKNRLHLQLGNIAMDKGESEIPWKYRNNSLIKPVFKLKNRLTNWHFYNPNKTSKAITRRVTVEQSQRRLWQRARHGFDTTSKAEEKPLFLGALIHFVEDVSVPAHVVPVYHGPFIPRIAGDFKPLYQYLIDANRAEDKTVYDAIDKLSPDTTWILEQFTSKDSPACAVARVPDDNPNKIRQQLAQATLDALQTEIYNCKGAHWKIFWNGTIDSKKNKYFEAYNINIPEFNRHGKIIDASGKYLCTMREGDWRYRQFLFDRHLDAVKADLRLLRWASQNMAK
jgi:hypothetical protein